MTYRELFYKATRLIDNGEITLGEYEEITKPLDREIEQEPCDDAISRKAVIDLVVANHTELNGLNVVMYSPFYKDITQLPSVNPQPNISEDGTLTVHVKDGSKVSRVLVCGDNHWGGLYYLEQEPKTGHWIELGCVGNDNYDFECSECHHTDTHTKNVEVPYCWKCGAKMESEEKE